MADQNPTGDGHIVTLSIPTGNEAFLRRVIGAAKDGIQDELERFGDRLGTLRSELLLEESAYSMLLAGFDVGRIVADREVRAALRRLAESIDHDNEYERVCFEHDSIADLLGQLEGRVA